MNVEPSRASTASYVRLVKLYTRSLERCAKIGSMFPSATIVSMCLKCAKILETLKLSHSDIHRLLFCEAHTVDDACGVQDSYAVARPLYDFLFKLLEIASQVSDSEHARMQLKGILDNRKTDQHQKLETICSVYYPYLNSHVRLLQRRYALHYWLLKISIKWLFKLNRISINKWQTSIH